MRKILLIFLMFSIVVWNASAQQKKVNGVVKDVANGQTLPFATISVLSAGKVMAKLAADANGNFSVDAQTGSIIQATFAGYEPKQVTALTIQLKSNTNLNEVVVVGYGTEKRKDLTSAATTISAKEISEAPSTNLATALASRAPGLCFLINMPIRGLFLRMFIRTCVMINRVSRLTGVQKVHWLTARICGGYREPCGLIPTWT
jgi:hypothetical protein